MLTFGTLAQAMGPLDQLAGPIGGVLFPCYRTCYFCVISVLCPCAVRVMSVLFQCYLRVIYMLTFGTLAQAMGPLDQLAGPFGGVLFPCYLRC